MKTINIDHELPFSLRNVDRQNQAPLYKKVMRLCAFAMVGNGKIDDSEKLMISRIIAMRHLSELKIDDYYQNKIVIIKNELSVKVTYENEDGHSTTRILKLSSDDIDCIKLVENYLDEKYIEDRSKKIEQLADLFSQYISNGNNKEKIGSNISELIKKDKNVDEICEQYSKGLEIILKNYAIGYQITEKCCKLLHDESNRKSLFMNVDSFEKNEIKQELVDIMLVARADYSLLDSEREAFRIICKLFKLRKTKQLWHTLTKINFGELIKLDFRNTDKLEKDDKHLVCDFRVDRKEKIDINDFKSIKKSISSFNIKGYLIDGVCHVLERERASFKDNIYHRDHKFNKYAIWLFVISAISLYIGISNVPYNKEHTNSEHIVSSNGSITLDSVYLRVILGDKLYDICKDNYIEIFILLLFLMSISLILYIRRNNKDEIKSNKKRLINRIKYAISNESIEYILLSIVTTLVMLYNTIALLVMMLSIEWLIFMKEQLSSNKSNVEKGFSNTNTVLIIIVVAAIVADICLGVVELNQDNALTIKNFFVKTSSALFLGCICFFSGKYLDNDRMQDNKIVEDMSDVINSIESKSVRV